MKLNIGCGLVYKKGYVNVDAYDGTVADKIMSATSLDFDDNTFTHVECIQVLEHLGAAKSIYALSEMYRVLKPGGLVLLETPDLVNSFKLFVRGKEKERKLLMNWIYGLDTPGMSHRYGFPRELLERVLREIGFTDIKIETVNTKSVNPSLRVICKKIDSTLYHTFSTFRRVLTEEKKVNLEDQIEVMEKEGLIQSMIQSTLRMSSNLDDDYVVGILETSALVSPIIGLIFLSSLHSNRLIYSTKITESLEILEKLDSVDFVNILIQIFSEMPVSPGFQRASFDTVTELGRQLVRKMRRREDNAFSNIERIAARADKVDEIDYFTLTGLEILSNKKVAQGLKAFAINLLDESTKYFQEAVRLDHDSVIAFWNLARLSVLEQNKEEMLYNYSGVKNILESKYPRNRRIIVNLEEEQKLAIKGHEKLFTQPKYSLY